MLRVIFLQIFFIAIRPNESIMTNNEEKMMKCLYKELSIKNVIVIGTTLPKKDVLFVKHLSRLNIYSSFLNIKEMDDLMQKYTSDKIQFIKTIVLVHKIGALIQLLTEKNEYVVSKFSWISLNPELLQYGEKYYVPYNTQFLAIENVKGDEYEISEIYHPSLMTHSLFKRRYGEWTEIGGLSVVEADFYQKRLDTNNTVLTLLYPEELAPAYWDFTLTIFKIMNFRIKIKEVGYQAVGKNPPAEMILLPKVVTHTSNYNPFVLGYQSKMEARLCVKYETTYDDYDFNYTRPFSRNLWQLILVFIKITTITLIIITIKLKNKNKINLLNAFFHSIEAFTNQDGGEIPTAIPYRIIMITIRLTALFIVPAYSAAVLTFILIPNIKLPFSDIKGFVEDGTYKLGFFTLSNYSYWFKKTNDPWSKTAYEKFLLNSTEMPETIDEQFEKVCEYDKTAVIFVDPLSALASCKVLKTPTPLIKFWRVLFLRKNCPYTKIFNKIFKNIMSSGVVNYYDKEGIYEVEKLEEERSREETTVKMESIVPILKLISILYLAAFVLFTIEIISKNKQKLIDYLQRKFR